MFRIIHFSLIVLTFSLLLSCRNSEADLLCYDVCMEGSESFIDLENSTIEISFPDNVRSAPDLCADFCLSEGAKAYVGDNLQQTGISKNNYEKPFEFRVVSEDKEQSKLWQVKSMNNDYTKTWGLGGFLQEEVSNNRTYDWYIDQSQTGYFSDYNCAPSCVVMASHWQDINSPYTVEDARSLYRPSGGGWFTQDIVDCLTDFSMRHKVITLSDYRDESVEVLMDNLEEGNIVLMAIDVHYLDDNFEPDVRINKYYQTIKLGTGHCIVIKGYKKVDGKIFFEVYDPIGYDFKYSDGSYKGKDRYYSSDDIYTAAFASWNFAFVILGPYSSKAFGKAVDVKDIPSILIL